MLLQSLLKEEEGQTLVEYGLLLALIALVVLLAVLIGFRLEKVYHNLDNAYPSP